MNQPVRITSNPRRQRVVLLIALALVAGFFAFAWQASRHNGSNAKVGDCLTPKGESSVSIVDCADPAATLKVVGRVEGKTQTDALIDACDAFESQGAAHAYWTGEQGKAGLVLCLAPKTK